MGTWDYRINSLLAGPKCGWNQHSGESATLHYNFDSSMSATYRALAQKALAAWSAVANLTFIEDTGNHHFYDSSISFREAPLSGKGGDAGIPFGGNTHIGVTINSIGGNDEQVFLHEIGHALGLKHPFDGPIMLPKNECNTNFSVMAYANGNLGPITPMAFDILNSVVKL